MPRIAELGHTGLWVNDLEKMRDFYTRVLGLTVTDEDPDAGMVFLWEGPVETTFWMKDTLIPLSIAFWNERGRIIEILDMAPCRQDDCPSYGPDEPFVGALEVNRGFFDDHGVEVGDRVFLENR